MPKLIDTDVLLEQWRRDFNGVAISEREKRLLELIQAQPAVDPVHIAGGCYCAECAYHYHDAYGLELVCERGVKEISPDGFCSLGMCFHNGTD